MPTFSRKSNSTLDTCHPDLQKLFRKVIQHRDCSIIEGHRSRARQKQLYADKKSKVQWPDSKHNSMPSTAVDVAPYLPEKGRVSWVPAQCYVFAGYVLRVADEMGIKIRWGGDWDGDSDVTDQSFNDLVHFELIR